MNQKPQKGTKDILIIADKISLQGINYSMNKSHASVIKHIIDHFNIGLFDCHIHKH